MRPSKLILIGLVTLAMALGLAVPKPVYSDEVEITLAEFLADYCSGKKKIQSRDEVEIQDGPESGSVASCDVSLPERTELKFGDNLSITVDGNFKLDGGGSSDVEVQFGGNTTVAAGSIEWSVGDDGEIQIGAGSTIKTTGEGDIKISSSADDARIRLGENTQMRSGGAIKLEVNGKEGSISVKKVLSPADPDSFFPNITAVGEITMKAGGDDGRVQIEQGNSLKSKDASITLEAGGSEGAVRTLGDVKLSAGTNIDLLAGGVESEVKVDVDNKFTAVGDITLKSGEEGMTEVKKGTKLAAGGTTTIKTGKEGKCTVEDPDTAGANCS